MDKDKVKELMKEIMGEEKMADMKAVEEPKVEADLTSIADKLADKIVGAISEKKNVTAQADKDNLKDYLFDPATGFKAAKYPADLANASDEQKIVAFMKAFTRRRFSQEDDQVFKALTEGTNADGGFLVPSPLAQEVWRILPDVSVMRRIGRTIPMTSQTLALNSLTGQPKPYWIAEYANKTTTSANFSQATLTAYKLVALLPVTHELLMDANIDLARFVIELFAEEIGRAEDTAFFTGNGTTQPKGINQETLSTVAAGGAVTFNHVISLIDTVPSRVSQSPRAAFVGNRYVKRILRQIKDNNGAYIWRDSSAGMMSGQTERLPDILYGYPFYEQNDLAQSELYFGDWSNYIIGDRQQIAVSSTDEGGDAWRRDATEFKAVERVGGTTVLTTAFAKITGI